MRDFCEICKDSFSNEDCFTRIVNGIEITICENCITKKIINGEYIELLETDYGFLNYSEDIKDYINEYGAYYRLTDSGLEKEIERMSEEYEYLEHCLIKLDEEKRKRETLKMKMLIIVDSQNDFIHGSLGSKEAQAIVPKIVEKIRTFSQHDCVFLTQDEHYKKDYLLTQEGQRLPIEHCILGTEGIKINKDILDAVTKVFHNYDIYPKNTFGTLELGYSVRNYTEIEKIESIELAGFCTDICVVTNALLLKTLLPEMKIIVDASCCAGVSPESHKAALLVMKSCQIEVINE